MSDKRMTCEEFFDTHFEEDADGLIQEWAWSHDYSSNMLLSKMQTKANSLGVTLTDSSSWNYDAFFWNLWNSTEKGLS